FQAEDGIRDRNVTGVQTCALPISRVNGYEVKLDEPVVLEIESEAEKGKAELEFEIKWEAGKKWGRGGRRLLLGAAASAAAGAVALSVLRRRRQQGEGDEYES